MLRGMLGTRAYFSSCLVLEREKKLNLESLSEQRKMTDTRWRGLES